MPSDFDSVQEQVRSIGEPVLFGTLLKEQASTAKLVCEQCGVLNPETRGVIEDWIHMCHLAMTHVQETGHRVAVDKWYGAVYGPQDLT